MTIREVEWFIQIPVTQWEFKKLGNELSPNDPGISFEERHKGVFGKKEVHKMSALISTPDAVIIRIEREMWLKCKDCSVRAGFHIRENINSIPSLKDKIHWEPTK